MAENSPAPLLTVNEEARKIGELAAAESAIIWMRARLSEQRSGNITNTWPGLHELPGRFKRRKSDESE